MLEERAATWPKQWMAEGLREALAEQMAVKFGALESRYQELIQKASPEQLKGWLKGILTASSAADLFRPPR